MQWNKLSHVLTEFAKFTLIRIRLTICKLSNIKLI